MREFKYIGADGLEHVLKLKDGFMYQIVSKERIDEVLKNKKILPKKIPLGKNTVPYVEKIGEKLAGKGKIFFTPSTDISQSLAVGTGYREGIVHKINIDGLKGKTVYHDPHVIAEVPSFFVTDPIDAKYVAYSYDKQKYLEYTTVAKHLTAIPTKVKILLNIQEEIKDFMRLSKPTLADGLTIGFNLGRNQNGGIMITAADMLDIPAARKILNKVALKAATKSLGTTQNDLAKVLANSIKLGDSAQQLAVAIGDKYNLEYLGKRSMTIARTEGTGILNAGTQEQMKEDGMRRKKWRATLGDDRTRESHIEVHHSSHEDPIPVNEAFDVGQSSGMYPGDQQLDIKERAQCRCALVGADFDEIRCRYYDHLFIREHGTYERKLQQVVSIYFRRMQTRASSRTSKISLP